VVGGCKRKGAPITSTQAIDLETPQMKPDQSSQDIIHEQHANMQASLPTLTWQRKTWKPSKLTNKKLC
jgi:hypothetical protein